MAHHIRHRRYAHHHGLGADDYQFGDEQRKSKRNKTILLVLAAAAALGIFFWSRRSNAQQPPPLPPDPAKPPPPPPEIPGNTTYTIGTGDSLSMVAAKLYGDGNPKSKTNLGWKWWPHLWDLNKSVIGCNWNLVRVGMVLSVPSPEALPKDQQDAVFARALNWKNPPATC